MASETFTLHGVTVTLAIYENLGHAALATYNDGLAVTLAGRTDEVRTLLQAMLATIPEPTTRGTFQ